MLGLCYPPAPGMRLRRSTRLISTPAVCLPLPCAAPLAQPERARGAAAVADGDDGDADNEDGELQVTQSLPLNHIAKKKERKKDLRPLPGVR